MELIAQADRSVSALEGRLRLVLVPDAREDARDTFLADLDAAAKQVFRAAARYLEVVDGIRTTAPEDVVQAAGHTGLLGEEEKEEANRLLGDLASAAVEEAELGRALHHVRFLRLWLERVRDTAAKAHD